MVYNPYTIPLIVSSLFLFIFAGFIAYKNLKSGTGKYFSLLSVTTGIWFFNYIFMYSSTDPRLAILFARIGYAGIIFIPTFLFGFTAEFLNNRIYKRIVPFTIVSGALFVLADIFGCFIKGVYKYYWGYYPKGGVLLFLFIIYFSVFFLFALREYLIAYINKQANSTQAGYLLLAFTFAITGCVDYLGNYGKEIYPIGYISATSCIAVVFYAITKHRLMDITVIISRTAAELMTVGLLGSIYTALILLYRAYVSTSLDLLFWFWSVLYGTFVGHVYLRVRLFMQTSADKVFLRGKYNYYKELSDASARVGEKLSLASILRILYATFLNVVEVSNPRIFLPENFVDPSKQSSRYVIYDKDTFQPQTNGEEIKNDELLVKQLISGRSYIHDPHSSRRELVVPCLLENRLIAIFVLGKKLSEDPYTDEDLRLLSVLASQAAITLDHTRSYEKIRNDLEVAEKQLARSQRLASLGTLTAGVTHEIRNPLTVIRSETERLAKQERNLEYLKQHRDLLLKHIDRISGIVQRMLGLAKERPRRNAQINLNEVIGQTLQFFTISKIKVVKELNKIPRIKANKEELQEIFVNLIQNSIDAMPKGGTLTLKTYTEDGRVVAEVSDNGRGIPEAIKERIFDPFFSTRHEGVGLGLSIAYRLIREHGGDIEVISHPGNGTTFKILF